MTRAIRVLAATSLLAGALATEQPAEPEPPTGSCPVVALDPDSTESCDPCSASPGASSDLVSMTSSAQSFPAYGVPISSEGATQLTVNVNIVFLRLDSIDVAGGTWVVRMQTDMYWDFATCQANEQLSDLCATRFGDMFYFGMPQQVQQPLGSTSNGRLSGTGIFAGSYAGGDCLHGDFVDATFTLGHSFQPAFYPFEAYKLVFKLRSFVDNATIRFNVLDSQPDATFEADMPDNWVSRNGLTCKPVDTCLSNAARGGTYCVSEVQCSIVVSAFSEGYLMTVFIFWFITMAANLLGGLGAVASTERTDGDKAQSAHDLREAVAARGVFSASFVLAYVFVVPPRPHELPLAGTMPTSTVLFLVGLANLIVCTFWSYMLSQTLVANMRDRRLFPRWWQVFLYNRSVIKHLRGGASGRKQQIEDLHQAASEVDTTTGISAHERELVRRQATLGRVDLCMWLFFNGTSILAAIAVLIAGKVENEALIQRYIDEVEAV